MASSSEATGTVSVGKVALVARWTLLVLAILSIIFLRTPEAILQPSLEAEDGTFVFPYYYANRGAVELLRFQGGYIPLELNLIAYVSVRLPTRFIPFGFALLPLLLGIVTYTWLFGSRFRAWLGSDATRAFICVLFVLAPIAQYHIYANATYSLWNALLLLLLIVVTPPSPVAWRNIAVWASANVLVWTNPLTVLVVPIVIIRFVRESRARLLHALTLVNVVIYSVVGVEKGGVFSGLTWVESVGKVVKAIGWTVAIVAGTAFRTVFGAPIFGRAEAGFWPLIAVWGLVVAGAAIFAAKQSSRLRLILLLMGYVIFSFTFFSVLGRGPSILVPLNEAPRYIYVPTLAFIILYVLLLDHFIVAGRPRRRAVVYTLVFVLYLALNAQLGHYFVATGPAARPPGGPNSKYVQSDAGNGRIVREFFAELERLEQQNGTQEGIYLKANKPGDWPILADTRNAQPNR